MTEWMYRTENTAETVLADVLNPNSDDGEQCSGCEAAYEWDHTRSYCPYHQGVLDGHDKAFGDLSQAAIAFQCDPELMDSVLDARARQKVYEYRAMQRAAANQPQPEPEGLSEHEHEMLNNSYADAEESPSSRWPEGVTVEIPGECLYCGLQHLRYHPTTANVSCAHCRAKQ